MSITSLLSDQSPGAARRKGRFIGGRPALGYDVDRKRHALIINQKEADLVRRIFDLYLKEQSLLKVASTINSEGHRTKQHITRSGKIFGGKPFNKTAIQWIIKNVLYTGKVHYKGEIYQGAHKPIVSEDDFKKVRDILKENTRLRSSPKNRKQLGLLSHLLYCKPCGRKMFYTYTRKKTRQYKYYVCQVATKRGYKHCPTKMIATHLVEKPIIEALNVSDWDSLLLEEQREKILELVKKAAYDRESETLSVNFTDGKNKLLEIQPTGEAKNPKKEFARIPTLKQQLLLAHQIQDFLDSGKATNLREISEWTGLSHSRICQVMNFLSLSPAIQEDIILGEEILISKIPEYKTRPICKESDPQRQCQLWQKLFN